MVFVGGYVVGLVVWNGRWLVGLAGGVLVLLVGWWAGGFRQSANGGYVGLGIPACFPR